MALTLQLVVLIRYVQGCQCANGFEISNPDGMIAERLYLYLMKKQASISMILPSMTAESLLDLTRSNAKES